MFFLFLRLEHPAGWICARYKSLLLLLLLIIFRRIPGSVVRDLDVWISTIWQNKKCTVFPIPIIFHWCSSHYKVNQDLSSLAGNQYTITVQCSDGITELSTPAIFIINIFDDGISSGVSLDINIVLSNSRVSEGQPADIVVGKFDYLKYKIIFQKSPVLWS